MFLFFMFLLLFFYSFHPLHMVLCAVFMCLTISLLIFKGLGGAWFSYVFILLFVGGLMVVFIYMSSLVPNEWYYSFFFFFFFFFSYFFVFLYIDYSVIVFYMKLGSFFLFSFFFVIFLSFLLFFVFLVVLSFVYSPLSPMKSYF